MSYTAIILEPRKHPALEFVLNNFLENLDYNWNIIIYHGTDNIDYINNIITTKLNKHIDRITKINLNTPNLTIQNYNDLMVSKKFIEDIPTEIFLIFQTDSMICSQNKDLIYNFIQYDYVGAPWLEGDVGNGGLSLRRKSKMLEIVNNCLYQPGRPEDVYFSKGCNNIQIDKPNDLEAKLFSVENIYSEKSFGVHKSWVLIREPQYNMERQCYGYNELYRLNNTEYFESNKQIEFYKDIQYDEKIKEIIKRVIIYVIAISICIILLIKK
jgi:hypothetical protein